MTTFAELLNSLRRSHLVVDGDCWFSCPKSGECCNEVLKDVCTCGADAHNARIDAALAADTSDPLMKSKKESLS